MNFTLVLQFVLAIVYQYKSLFNTCNQLRNTTNTASLLPIHPFIPFLVLLLFCLFHCYCEVSHSKCRDSTRAFVIRMETFSLTLPCKRNNPLTLHPPRTSLQICPWLLIWRADYELNSGATICTCPLPTGLGVTSATCGAQTSAEANVRSAGTSAEGS